MRVQLVRRVRLSEEIRYLRSDRLALDKKGRWGARWLHRLIWVMALNTGMIRHVIDEQRVMIRTVIDDADPIFTSVRRQALDYLEQDFRRDDLILIMGHKKLDEAVSETSSFMTGRGEFTMEAGRQSSYGPEYRMVGIRAYLIPALEGAIVLPRSFIS